MPSNISDRGLELLMKIESKSNKIYLDQAGLPTIGVGHLITTEEEKKRFEDGITDDEVFDLLKADMVESNYAVRTMVKVSITQEQFDALVILEFNIGFNGFKTSTALKLINELKPLSEIEPWWKAWNKVTIDGVKQVSPGLVNRRNSEWNVYTKGEYKWF